MDDLISRQDAIDAFRKATADGDKVDFCVSVINDLPSAQPKFPEDEICLEGETAAYKEGWNDAIDTYAQQWIPCSERLPEEGKEVFVTVWGRCEVASYNRASDGLQEWEFDGFSLDNLDNEDFIYVTAWMPLPKPWKGEQDE